MMTGLWMQTNPAKSFEEEGMDDIEDLYLSKLTTLNVIPPRRNYRSKDEYLPDAI